MKCPGPERIAELATVGSEDEELVEHVAECVACRGLLEQQREVREWMAAVPEERLTPGHREALAAEVLARAEGMPIRGGRRRGWIAIAGAAAAVIAAVIAWPRAVGVEPVVVGMPGSEEVAVRERVARGEEVAAPTAAEVIEAEAKIAGSGEIVRERDVVKLNGGEIVVDAVGRKGTTIVNGDTAVGVKGAKVRVIAKRGVIAQVAVFAGSAEVTVGGKKIVIEQGMTWERNAAREDALASFRTGWEALRGGDNAAALAAFDAATADDVVAEDAIYWGAIAAERLGDTEGAVRRYRALLEKFPKSPRAEAATAAIARLAR